MRIGQETDDLLSSELDRVSAIIGGFLRRSGGGSASALVSAWVSAWDSDETLN